MARPLIVLVDDEPNIRATISFILEMEGFRVETAVDGEEGLEKIRALKTAGCAFGRHDAATRRLRRLPEPSRATRHSPASR